MLYPFLRCCCWLIAVAMPLSSSAQTSATEQFREEVAAAATIKPRYLLQSMHGHAVSDQDFPGRFQLITFGYTFCPDICPTTLTEMSQILKQLGEEANRVQAIFISVDPERDTPSHLASYLAFFDARILGLTGSPAMIRKVAQNYRVKYEKSFTAAGDASSYSVDHSSGMYLLGPKGQLIQKIAFNTPVENITDVIRAKIRQSQTF